MDYPETEQLKLVFTTYLEAALAKYCPRTAIPQVNFLFRFLFEMCLFCVLVVILCFCLVLVCCVCLMFSVWFVCLLAGGHDGVCLRDGSQAVHSRPATTLPLNTARLNFMGHQFVTLRTRRRQHHGDLVCRLFVHFPNA